MNFIEAVLELKKENRIPHRVSTHIKDYIVIEYLNCILTKELYDENDEDEDDAYFEPMPIGTVYVAFNALGRIVAVMPKELSYSRLYEGLIIPHMSSVVESGAEYIIDNSKCILENIIANGEYLCKGYGDFAKTETAVSLAIQRDEKDKIKALSVLLINYAKQYISTESQEGGAYVDCNAIQEYEKREFNTRASITKLNFGGLVNYLRSSVIETVDIANLIAVTRSVVIENGKTLSLITLTSKEKEALSSILRTRILVALRDIGIAKSTRTGKFFTVHQTSNTNQPSLYYKIYKKTNVVTFMNEVPITLEVTNHKLSEDEDYLEVVASVTDFVIKNFLDSIILEFLKKSKIDTHLNQLKYATF